MNKKRMKNVSLTMLVILTMTVAMIPMVIAPNGIPMIIVVPGAGNVPADVAVLGSGFTPCGNVEIYWDLDGAGGLVDVLLGVAETDCDGYFYIEVTIPESFCGSHEIAAWDIASGHGPYITFGFLVIPKIKLTPRRGPVDTEVTVEGTGFKAGVYVDIYYDGEWQTEELTDPVTGSFTTTFNVPESVCGRHTVLATDRTEEPCEDEACFRVKPHIVLDPAQGPCETEVAITGTGFGECELVDISFKGCSFPETYWEYDVTETCIKGSFEYVFTVPCCVYLDKEECYEVCPGVYCIDAKTDECRRAYAKFIVTPWFTVDPDIGPVDSEVTAYGYGFGAEEYVDVKFKGIAENILVGSFQTDSEGNFEETFNVPEVVEGCYKVVADGVEATYKCCEDLCFEVIPWIWLDIESGNVGDTVTVTGKGWDALRNVDIIYGGIGNCPDWPLIFESMIAPHMAMWWAWEMTAECSNIKGILQPWGWALIAEAYTDPNGSFEVTFEVPESPGGFHPIYAGQCDEFSWWWYGPCRCKLSRNVPLFRVEPEIWIEGHEGLSEGLSEEYVTLYGTGFSYVEAWFSLSICERERDRPCDPCDTYLEVEEVEEVEQEVEHGRPKIEFEMYFRVGTFVLDFGSNEQWINEFNFILNNEYSEGWQEMYWAWLKAIFYGEGCPMFPEGYLPMYLDQNGTISHGYWWRWLWVFFYHETLPFSDAFYDDMTFKGTPFLKVPVQQPGEKDVVAYYFGLEFSLSMNLRPCFMPLEGLPAELGGLVEGVPEVLAESAEDPMGLLFGHRPPRPDVEIHLGKIDTETATTEFTILKDPVECDTTEILEKLDQISTEIIKIEGSLVTIDTELGTIQVGIGEINGQLTSINGRLATVETDIGTMKVDVSDINAGITTINEGIATIETDIGTIHVDLSSIDASITATNGKIVTIETTLGTVQTDLTSIDASITATNGKIVTIETALGKIQTDLSSINGELIALKDEMVTIGTDIGEFTVNLEEINTNIAVTNGKVAIIETDVGTIKGLVTSVDGDVATIQTDIGTMKGTLGEIKNDTHLQPATVGLSILAAIAAIAAAVMILRKVYLK